MASSSIRIGLAAAKIGNVGELRAAMGAVTLTLSQGYAVMDGLTNIAGVQDAARTLLDTVNKSAGLLYAKYPDPQLAAGAYGPPVDLMSLSTWDAHLAGVVVAEANDALASVEKVAAQNLFDIAQVVSDAIDVFDAEIAAVGGAVGAAVQDATNALASGVSAFVTAAWPTLLLVGLGVTAYVYRGKIVKALRATT